MMNFKFIKHIFLFFLFLLLGIQNTYAKTELILSIKSISFSTEKTQVFTSLEKRVQPNIGFLKEKVRFVTSEGVSTQNQHEFSDYIVYELAEAGNIFKVDNALKLADETAGVLVNGKYLKNPTAKNVTELIKNPSGSMKLNQKSNSILNGQYMYVIDEADNIIIGTRATGINPFNGKAPHPTLIGGTNPTVKTAGIIEFRGGKIYKVDNVSGHFKPSAQSLQNSESIFNQNFSPNNFATDFQGYIPFKN